MLENAQAAPDAEIVATRIVGVVALVDVMVDAMEIVKEHVRRTVLLMVVPECAVDVRAAATVILGALPGAVGVVEMDAIVCVPAARELVKMGVTLDAKPDAYQAAAAAPGARAHALDVRHAAAAPDALPGVAVVVIMAAPDRVSYHAAETAHQRVLTPVLERVRR